ncbi:hypothetical protein BDB00DRAFT_793327 [Zychaea mexicana]|uniref:uncharacterized protein n=1 Tax=Zychaea mexicana TaxID=64656 RepID=UPI0022FE9E05|nr:uncharacterized protein BDB00DRAFT_793327 [Zychaea mexicana]KAI9477087.1 hypothetical protein BDB00DRAFT_793327 [Zychaea mexicana]
MRRSPDYRTVELTIVQSRKSGSDDYLIKKQNNKKNPDSNDNTNPVMESHIHQVQFHLEKRRIGEDEQDGSFCVIIDLLKRHEIRADQTVYNAVNIRKNYLRGYCASFIAFLSPLGSEVGPRIMLSKQAQFSASKSGRKKGRAAVNRLSNLKIWQLYMSVGVRSGVAS